MNKEKLRVLALAALAIFVLAALAGCGAGKTMVMKPADAAQHVRAVDLQEADPPVRVPEEVRKKFL